MSRFSKLSLDELKRVNDKNKLNRLDETLIILVGALHTDENKKKYGSGCFFTFMKFCLFESWLYGLSPWCYFWVSVDWQLLVMMWWRCHVTLCRYRDRLLRYTGDKEERWWHRTALYKSLSSLKGNLLYTNQSLTHSRDVAGTIHFQTQTQEPVCDVLHCMCGEQTQSVSVCKSCGSLAWLCDGGVIERHTDTLQVTHITRMTSSGFGDFYSTHL